MRKGIHKKTYSNGATYRGMYLDDKRHGYGVKTHADGTDVQRFYLHGIMIEEYKS